MRDILEHKIAYRPDDEKVHVAYADWLTAQGDPRGEFIHLQLALEYRHKPVEMRAELRARERELLNLHRRTWLGELAPLLLDSGPAIEWYGRPILIHFRRGWLEQLSIGQLTVDLARVLVDSPLARMLAELTVDYVPDLSEQDFAPGPDLPFGERARQEFNGLTVLANSDAFTNLRRLRLGDDFDKFPELGSLAFGTHAASFIERLPRLEELRLFTMGLDTDRLFALPLLELRHLQLYHVTHYPLEKLADNPSLGNLTHLRLFPQRYVEALNRVGGGSFLPISQVRALVESKRLPSLTHLQLWSSNLGDAGIEAIVTSGILKQLRVLDLRYGCVTDIGEKLLADCAEARNLIRLDLSNNWLTEVGAEVLHAAGIAAETAQQREMGDEGYLLQGEYE